MSNKNDKKLCWSCEGKVELGCEKCPYCGTDLTSGATGGTNAKASSVNMASQAYAAPYTMSSSTLDDPPPKPPYAGFSQANTFTPSNKEWEEALRSDLQASKPQEESTQRDKQEIFALMLLLPGIVFFLFGIALLLFSQEGIFTLCWHQNFSYFYFVGALPLLYLGYKALK